MKIDQASARHLMAYALNSHVGMGRKHSYPEISVATGIRERRLYWFKNGERDPSWPELMALISVLGPAFQNKLTIEVGIGGAIKFDDPLPVESLPIHAATFLERYTIRMADGTLCNRDIGHLLPLTFDLRDAAHEAATAWSNGVKR